MSDQPDGGQIVFSLDEDQRAKLEAWEAARQPVTPENAGASGAAYTYSFTPTSIGTVVMVVDNRTGDVIDLTDYDGW